MKMLLKAGSPNWSEKRPVRVQSLQLRQIDKIRSAAKKSNGIKSFIAGILAAAAKVPLDQDASSNAGAQ